MSTGLQVLKALYGTGSKTVDVTSAVSSKVKDGSLNFTVSPTTLNVDDPATGQLKTLDISYTINDGATNTMSIKDNDLVDINAPPATTASGLQIIKAEYGYAGNMTDVTDSIQTQVSDGKINLTVSPRAVGIPDPNPNKQKYLVVEYSINGARSSEQIVDGKVFKLSAPPVDAKDGRTPRQKAGSVISSLISSFTTFLGLFIQTFSVGVTFEFAKKVFPDTAAPSATPVTGWMSQIPKASGFAWMLTFISVFIPLMPFWLIPFVIFWLRMFRSTDIV